VRGADFAGFCGGRARSMHKNAGKGDETNDGAEHGCDQAGGRRWRFIDLLHRGIMRRAASAIKSQLIQTPTSPAWAAGLRQAQSRGPNRAHRKLE
jgi:hypothetical protein